MFIKTRAGREKENEKSIGIWKKVSERLAQENGMHSNPSISKIFQGTLLDLILLLQKLIRDKLMCENFFIFIRFIKKIEHQFNTQAQ